MLKGDEHMAKRRIALRTLMTLVAMALLFAVVAGQASAAKASKVGICHSTLEPSNPYEYISVSQNAVKAHQAHHNGADVIGVSGPQDCPQPTPPPQCSDGIDNDGDGLTDFPLDLGCDNADDNSEVNAQPCNSLTTAGGTGVTETVHQLGVSSGTFDFSYDAFSIPDQFEVIYEGNTLLDTGSVSGAATVPITYSGTSTEVTVRVTGPDPSTAWEYTVACPAPPV